MPRYKNLAELQRDVKRDATEPQRAAIIQWEDKGWHVYSAKYQGSVGVVFLSHPESLGPCAIYPDGTPQRASKGKKTVHFNWAIARDSMAKLHI